MSDFLIFISGVAFTLMWILLLRKPKEQGTLEEMRESLRLCQETGGHHEWSTWEDWSSTKQGTLIQIRRCKRCNLANEAHTLPIQVEFHAPVQQADVQ